MGHSRVQLCAVCTTKTLSSTPRCSTWPPIDWKQKEMMKQRPSLPAPKCGSRFGRLVQMLKGCDFIFLLLLSFVVLNSTFRRAGHHAVPWAWAKDLCPTQTVHCSTADPHGGPCTPDEENPQTFSHDAFEVFLSLDRVAHTHQRKCGGYASGRAGHRHGLECSAADVAEDHTGAQAAVLAPSAVCQENCAEEDDRLWLQTRTVCLSLISY